MKPKKFYQVVLNKPLKPSDLDLIREGLELEDGLAPVDGADYVKGASKKRSRYRKFISAATVLYGAFLSILGMRSNAWIEYTIPV